MNWKTQAGSIRWANTIGPETIRMLNDWAVQLARSQ
jgi:hypothetical protein